MPVRGFLTKCNGGCGRLLVDRWMCDECSAYEAEIESRIARKVAAARNRPLDRALTAPAAVNPERRSALMATLPRLDAGLVVVGPVDRAACELDLERIEAPVCNPDIPWSAVFVALGHGLWSLLCWLGIGAASCAAAAACWLARSRNLPEKLLRMKLGAAALVVGVPLGLAASWLAWLLR